MSISPIVNGIAHGVDVESDTAVGAPRFADTHGDQVYGCGIAMTTATASPTGPKLFAPKTPDGSQDKKMRFRLQRSRISEGGKAPM
jgi:hypothetical protein